MKVTRRANVESKRLLTNIDLAGRILAIDYGRKRIGLALSDELRLTAQPLAVLTRTNRQNDLRRLRELCRRHQVRKILVGHPLLLTGEESEMTKEASRFAARLVKNLGIAVELVDERLTSWEAEQTQSGASRCSRDGRPLDDVAAALILRDFLQRNVQQNSTLSSSAHASEAC